MLRIPPGPALALALLLLPARPALEAQQPEEVLLTLARAEEEALAGNPSLRAARERARAAERASDGAAAFRWPGLRADAGVLRTDDPVAVFGAKLRQERFGPADLDIAALNDPAAVSDWSAGLGAGWDIADVSRWRSADAARQRAAAARAGAERGAEATVYRTRMLYLGVLRARGHTAAAGSAVEAAEATLDRVRRRRDEGMATDADVLQAEAALAEARARVIRAGASVDDAADALGTHLGWSADRRPVPAESLAEVAVTPATGTGDATRADLVASARRMDAARAAAGAAAAARWPTVSAFGRLGTHAPAFADDPSANWTAGVQVSVPLFAGGGIAAAAAAAAAEARAVEAEHEARVREADDEVASARRAVEAWERALDAARSAEDAAREAVRLLRRRYEEGMTTLSDLLQAEATAARLDAGRVDAEAGLRAAEATLAFALGETTDTEEGDAR